MKIRHLIADLIGTAAIFATLYGGLIIGHALGV